MSSSRVRSRGGCLTCKSKHKKCDETKPSCQQCERSGLGCSGYAFLSCDAEGKTVKSWKRPRSALPAHQGAAVVHIHQTAATGGSDPKNSSSALQLLLESTEPLTLTEEHQPNTTGCEPLQHRSFHSAHCATTPGSIVSYTPTIKIFSHPTIRQSNMAIGQRLPFPLTPNYSHTASPSLDTQDSKAGHVYIRRVLFGALVLDRNSESNSLPFVLESLATWIHRSAFDPVKVARKYKNLIVNHYMDSVESRCMIILQANLVRRSAKCRLTSQARTPEYMSVVCTLQKQVYRRISLPQSASHFGETGIRDAAIVLDNIINMVVIFALTGDLKPGLELMAHAAPLVHRARPEYTSKQIHLQALFLGPIGGLRDYATGDILASAMTSRPMLFQYDTSIDPELGSSILSFSDDAGIHWGRGVPDQITLVFARINMLRGTLAWDQELFNETEIILREFVPVPTVSSEPGIMVRQAVVQECWRQAAYIYLYMGLCGASSDDPRVMQALSRFLNIIKSVKCNHFPDFFIRMCLVIAGVAAKDKIDRDFIRYRMLGVEEFLDTGGCNPERLEELWERVDFETRPAVWADLMRVR